MVSNPVLRKGLISKLMLMLGSDLEAYVCSAIASHQSHCRVAAQKQAAENSRIPPHAHTHTRILICCANSQAKASIKGQATELHLNTMEMECINLVTSPEKR